MDDSDRAGSGCGSIILLCARVEALQHVSGLDVDAIVR